MVSCRLVLGVPSELALLVSCLLAADRREIGTWKRTRRGTCRKQALFGLAWFRDKGDADRCLEKTLSRTRVVRSGRRPAFGILASTITVAVIAVAPIAIGSAAASASVRPTSPQKAGMAELMK